jgi:hypothetical protein
MRPHSIGQTVMDRADFQIDGFHGSKGAFNMHKVTAVEFVEKADFDLHRDVAL